VSEPNVICIQVVRRDGGTETLTLTGPLIIQPKGPDETFARLLTSTGMEHWFYGDGTYDGWGMSFPDGGVPMPVEDAMSIALAIDGEREITPPNPPQGEESQP
jgi:hypothetical protein